jgi:hypothetical protein
VVGQTRFALARALWSTPSDRRRAITLARQAKTELTTDREEQQRVAAWLQDKR